MQLRHVIKVVVYGDEPNVRDEGAPTDDGDASALPHWELDELLLREARRSADELRKASVALQAASAVVLEAVAALHEERERR